MKKIIYDLGAGDGSNIPYYLLKADTVVAVEANPRLCQIIKNKMTPTITITTSLSIDFFINI